ncbi:MAG: dihydrolipoamide acetyltransferase family protein [Myxococcota bacterium]
MAQDVIMPQMGESIAEGTITNWLKKVGDTVERDEPLFEISTDKVDAEIPSPAAGVLLEIKAEAGATVPINEVVAVIGEAGESAGDSAPASEANGSAAAEPAPAPAPAPSSPPASTTPAASSSAPREAKESSDASKSVKSSPVVRKIAAEHDVDISQIEGSGIGGRVTKQDILAFIDNGGASGGGASSAASSSSAISAPAPQAPAPTQMTQAPIRAPAPSSPTRAPVGQTLSSSAPAAESGGGNIYDAFAPIPDAYRARVFEGDRVEPLSNMRIKIAEHMTLSKRISPHVQTVWDVDFSRVAALRKKYKGAWMERHEVNLTYTAFILKAAVDALKSFPVVNASLDGTNVIYHQSVNLGVAVALDWGLIVPVIHRADELNLLGLARKVNDLGDRARNRKLMPDEVSGGTFTVTNPGVFGPLFGIPAINQPQVGIMGVGAVQKRPVVVDDAIAIRTRCYLSMSFDHRLVDGAVADQFMGRVAKSIEEFDENEL